MSRQPSRCGAGRLSALASTSRFHDGFDLGWKLAWVLRGWATSALLDTYEAERRPVAEHIAARSADPTGTRRTAEQEVHADLGGRIAHVWSDERSTLDLLGTGLTLFTGRDGAAWDRAVATLSAHVPVSVQASGPNRRPSDRRRRPLRAPRQARRAAGRLTAGRYGTGRRAPRRGRVGRGLSPAVVFHTDSYGWSPGLPRSDGASQDRRTSSGPARAAAPRS
jgi:hypothetical protein